MQILRAFESHGLHEGNLLVSLIWLDIVLVLCAICREPDCGFNFMMMVIDCRDMSMRYRLHMSAGHSLSYVQSICRFGIASTDCILRFVLKHLKYVKNLGHTKVPPQFQIAASRFCLLFARLETPSNSKPRQLQTASPQVVAKYLFPFPFFPLWENNNSILPQQEKGTSSVLLRSPTYRFLGVPFRNRGHPARQT